ncbi:hypothetical protein [Pelagibacterium mangrovi]|uniref:hypothetical protein n=1 Tax=Pelagibacterium mangrovi TaxID=3119828 RepID=UPI002FC65F30
MTDRDRKMRVELTKEQAVYIHNDLGNTAFYFKKRIVERLEKGDHDGIFLEMTAGLTMTAFAMEASVNFVGDRIFGEAWDEWEPSLKKVKQVLSELGVDYGEFEKRPFSSIIELKKLRDTLAHGKPERITSKEIVIGTYDELYARQRIAGGWEAMVTVENVVDWYDDMNDIWKMMIDAAGIEVIDTMSTGSHGMHFIEYVD